MNAKEELIEELEEHIAQVRKATFKNPFYFIERSYLGIVMVRKAEFFDKIDLLYNNNLCNEIDKILESS